MNRVLFVAAASAALLAAGPGPAVQDRVRDAFVPAPYEGQTIAGILGPRLKVNVEGRLLRVDERALIEGFETRPGKHPWIGEHIGKFLHAAVNSYRYSRNPELKRLMDRLAAQLIAAQMSDGYLGTYTEAERWISWDVWAHKYNLIGLLAYYELTGDERALAACRRMGDLLARTFGDAPGKLDIIKAGTHVGMASTSVLESIAMLYRFTGEPRYLEFARYVVRSWDQPHGPHILSNLLSAGKVVRAGNGKAYELMSNLVGLADLYRLTGETSFRDAALNAWSDIRAHHRYITGTVSSREYFRGDQELPGEEVAGVGEGCATVTWLQLNWQLLRLTGEARFAEELERTVYNQLLAAQDPSTGNICYFTPMVGRKRPSGGISCCVSSEPRGISMIPQIMWGSKGNGVAILLYNAGEARIPVPQDGGIVPVSLRVTTEFPRAGKIEVSVEPERTARFPVWLRVPAWTRSFQVECAGQTFTGKPGEYVTIERAWNPKDTIRIAMDLPATLISGGESYPGYVAIQRGPQVLALEKQVNKELPYLHRAGLAESSAVALRELPAGQLYAIRGVAAVPRSGGGLVRQPREVTLVPFADALDYRVWLPVGGRLSVDPVPATAFGRESQSGASRRQESIVDERPDTWRTARTGAAREDLVWFAVELAEPALIRRVVYRHGETAVDGGWFETKAGKPEIQVQRERKGEWVTVGVLEDYPWLDYTMFPAFKAGQPFELVLREPVPAVAVRVRGRPVREFASCAELSAYTQ